METSQEEKVHIKEKENRKKEEINSENLIKLERI